MELPSFISPFLLSVDKATNEIFVFHREEPQYLVWVKQETPLRFIIVEYYDDNLDPDYVLAHPSLAECRKYVTKLLVASI